MNPDPSIDPDNVALCNDHEVHLQAKLIPRFCWTTAFIDVYIDGACILESGGQLSHEGAMMTTYADASGNHEVALRWGVGMLRSFPCVLYIDADVVLDTRVPVSNWPIGILLWIVILGAGIAGLLAAQFFHWF